jgi:DNA-binding transcriptional ArsR family regulator
MLRDAVAFHPDPGQISLSGVFDALSDPVRRLIVARLARHGELNCSCFLDYGSKTAISYHLARLREAGITRTRRDGKLHYMALRTADLEQRFPGLIQPVLANALAEEKAAGAGDPQELAEVIGAAKKAVAQRATAPDAEPAPAPAARKPSARKAAARKSSPARRPAARKKAAA